MVAGRGRAVVIGVGSNTAMGSIHDSMLQTDDVSYHYSLVFIWKCTICTFNILCYWSELSYKQSLYCNFDWLKLPLMNCLSLLHLWDSRLVSCCII